MIVRVNWLINTQHHTKEFDNLTYALYFVYDLCDGKNVDYVSIIVERK
jgi:hypothetical protein